MGTKRSTRVKIISVGDVETGKSCLIKRYCEKRFVSKYLPTIGVDFGAIHEVVDDWELKINLFDLSGHAAFLEVRNEFYKDTQAVLLVYDVTSKASFDNLDKWWKEIKQYCNNNHEMESFVFVLCANKTDKKNSRVIDFSKGREWAQARGIYYYETSSLNGEGVVEAFHMLFKCLVQVLETGHKPKSSVHHDVKKQPSHNPSKEQTSAIDMLKNSKDNYSRLGLSYGASKDEINKSYRRLARLLHPDKCDVPGADDAFRILGSTKDALLSKAK